MNTKDLLIPAASLLLLNAAAHATLITNGGFEAGNSGFTSDYFHTPGTTTAARQYRVESESSTWWIPFTLDEDHTTGTGRFLMANASETTTHNVWEQSVNVQSGSTYVFSGWVAELYAGGPNNATLEFSVGGTSLGSIVTTDLIWTQFSGQWVSDTTGPVELAIRETTRQGGGADFGIDDLAFSSVPEGLVAHYALDGTGLDASDNELHAQINGPTPTSDRFGITGSALLFDGIDDFVEFGVEPFNLFGAEEPSAFAFWVRLDSSDREMAFFTKGLHAQLAAQQGNQYLATAFFASKQNFNMLLWLKDEPRNSLVSLPDTFKEEIWHHVVFMRGPEMKIYIDGNNVTAEAVNAGWLRDFNANEVLSGAPLRFGRRDFVDSGPDTYFHGALDEVYIFNRLLSEAEIRTLAGLSGDTDGDGLTDEFERGVGRYSLIAGDLTWTDAVADAINRNGHLLTVISESEWNSVFEILGAEVLGKDLWAGGTDEAQEGTWTWVTGEAWDFTAWSPLNPSNSTASGQPGEDYLHLDGSGFPDTLLWNDWPEDPSTYFQRGMDGYILEIGYFTDPNNPDTDGDGLTDGEEWTEFGTIPTSPDSVTFLLTSIEGVGTIETDPPEGPYPVGSTVTLTAVPQEDWIFVEWSGDAGGQANPLEILMDGDKSITAIFSSARFFSLTTEMAGGGTVSIDPPGGSYPANALVTVTAMAREGWQFLYWTGDAAGADPEITLTIDGNKTVEAVFGTSLNTPVFGQGTVLRNPEQELYPFGMAVQLSAIPDAGHYFVIWGGATASRISPLKLIIDHPNPTISALFEPLGTDHVALTILIEGNGTMASDPQKNAFAKGENVTLTATPDEPFQFNGWSGDASGKENPLTITMDRSKVITAAFGEDMTFTKITTGDVVNDGGDSRGGSWGDFNNDGFQDLVVPNWYNQGLFLYRNNGDGVLNRTVAGDLGKADLSSLGAAWGDYNNDGHLDLIAANISPDGANLLYRNAGNGTFELINDEIITAEHSRSVACAWADFDRDGNLDLFITNNGGTEENPLGNNYLYQNLGNSQFTKITTGSVVSDLGRFHQSAWSDYDNDGDPDLFVTTTESDSPNLMYRNNGNGTFTKITSGSVVSDLLFSWCCAWGDYDADGYLDLFVGNNARNSLYHNDGNGAFTRITQGPVVNDGETAASISCAWGDYDNDGYLDLFVANRGGQNTNFLYRYDGENGFERITSGDIVNDATESTGAAWADYDNDGDLDLFVANWQGVNNSLYRNNGNDSNWISITCVGTRSNRAAIGAKLRLKATINDRTMWQLREISGGHGLAQNSLRAHFGLGDATTVETLRIEWPSGIDQELHNLPANRFLTIHEPPVLAAIGFLGEDQFELTIDSRGGWDYTIESSTDLEAWRFLSDVLNVNGEVQVVDPEAGSVPYRFYRAVQPFSAVHGFVRITEQDPTELRVDPVRISSAEVFGNALQLEVSYSGGCVEHDFALFMSPDTFAESNPVQAGLWLQHRDRDDPCDGMVLQTLTFDLRPVAGLHQQVYGRKDRIQLNVNGSEPGEAVTLSWKPE